MSETLTPVGDPSQQTSDGLSVYIGAVPAEIVKEEHPTMHGGFPAASNEYHLVVLSSMPAAATALRTQQ